MRADLKIREIAEQCGYKSPQAFDRAFQTYFGMPPTEWRAGGYSKWNAESSESSAESITIENDQIQVKNIQRFRVAYQRKVGPYNEGEAGLWSRLAQLADSLNLGNQECYGIGLDDPSVTPSARCRFDACIKLPPSLTLPHHVPVKTIAGGNYAVLAYSGPAGGTKRHWDWLCRSWLPASGYKISHNFCFERYPHGLPRTGAQVQSELYFPLRK